MIQMVHEATVTATPLSFAMMVAVLTLAACVGNLLLSASATASLHITLEA
jgi:hypothetical protein